MSTPVEFWLRGIRVPDISEALQPVAHALYQALEDAEAHAGVLTEDDLWRSLNGAATVGFHLAHMAGSIDRLLTYARGDQLSRAQRERLSGEKSPHPSTTVHVLLAELRTAVDRAIEQLRATSEEQLDEPRQVGRAGMPATVRGLLYHVGEHTSRHAGQLITTVRILRGR